MLEPPPQLYAQVRYWLKTQLHPRQAVVDETSSRETEAVVCLAGDARVLWAVETTFISLARGGIGNGWITESRLM